MNFTFKQTSANMISQKKVVATKPVLDMVFTKDDKLTKTNKDDNDKVDLTCASPIPSSPESQSETNNTNNNNNPAPLKKRKIIVEESARKKQAITTAQCIDVKKIRIYKAPGISHVHDVIYDQTAGEWYWDHNIFSCELSKCHGEYTEVKKRDPFKPTIGDFSKRINDQTLAKMTEMAKKEPPSVTRFQVILDDGTVGKCIQEWDQKLQGQTSGRVFLMKWSGSINRDYHTIEPMSLFNGAILAGYASVYDVKHIPVIFSYGVQESGQITQVSTRISPKRFDQLFQNPNNLFQLVRTPQAIYTSLDAQIVSKYANPHITIVVVKFLTEKMEEFRDPINAGIQQPSSYAYLYQAGELLNLPEVCDAVKVSIWFHHTISSIIQNLLPELYSMVKNNKWAYFPVNLLNFVESLIACDIKGMTALEIVRKFHSPGQHGISPSLFRTILQCSEKEKQKDDKFYIDEEFRNTLERYLSQAKNRRLSAELGII